MDARFLTLLRRRGLPHIADELAALVRPSIWIRTGAGSASLSPAIGASRIGGTPDFPTAEWPRRNDVPLVSLAQFNLVEVAPYDSEGLLPRAGMLYFFIDENDDGMPSGLDEGVNRTIFHNVTNDALIRLDRPASHSSRSVYDPCSIYFGQQATLPTWLRYMNLYYEDIHDFNTSEHVQRFTALRDANPQEREVFKSVLSAFQRDEAVSYYNRLLGCPDEIQHDLSFGPDQDLNWRLLFQLDSVDNARMSWGDCGLLYFLIRQDDLLARDFTRLWLTMQCC